MTVATSEQFVSLLEQSNLLTPQQLESVSRMSYADGKSLAKALVNQGLITAWQAGLLLAGRTKFFLGKYKLLDEIGRGGMGKVLKAEQQPFGRQVAIKLMSQDLVRQKTALSRFYQEIQAAAALQHPNIVSALDADHVGDTHFLVMEFIDGKNLDEIIKRRHRLPAGAACEYIRQAAIGLQHAHERGMVHRDIKPSNLLLTWRTPDEPIVKVLDMGLARMNGQGGEDTGLTQTGEIMGTPDYISPEQARNTHSADARSDIYSLGCTLFRFLTGRVPYTGSSVMEKLMARATEDAPPLRQFFPEAPEDLEAIVAKSLARNPDDRFQTAQELANALIPFCIVPTAPPPGSATALHRASDSSLKINAVDTDQLDRGLGQFLQALAHEAEEDVAPVTLSAVDEVDAPLTQPLTQVAEFDPSNSGERIMTRAGARLREEIEQRKRADQKRWLIVAGVIFACLLLVGAAAVYRSMGKATLVIDWPEELREGGSLEINGHEISLPDSGDVLSVDSPGPRFLKLKRPGYLEVEESFDFGRGEKLVFAPKWKPTLATIRQNTWEKLRDEFQEKLKVLPATAEHADEEVQQLVEQLNSFQRRWSASYERQVMSELRAKLPSPLDGIEASPELLPQHQLERLRGGESAEISKHLLAVFGDSRFSQSSDIYGIDVSSVEPLVATAGSDGSIHLWEIPGGQLRSLFRISGGAPRCIALSRDGAMLATGCSDDRVRLLDTGSGELLETMTGHKHDLNAVAFSPDGQWLASASRDHTVRIWDTRTYEEITTLLTDTWNDWGVHSLDFSLDGKWLAVGNEDRTVDLYKAGSWELFHTFEGFPSSLHAVVFSPDSKLLATGTWNGVLKVWNVDDSTLRYEAIAHSASLQSLAFSPDGTMLASGGRDNRANIWNAADGMLLKSFNDHRNNDHCLGFTPDSRILVVASHSDAVRLWDLETGESFNQPMPNPTCVAINRDGSTLFVGTAGGSVMRCNATTGTQIDRLELKNNRITTLAVSEAGTWFAAGTDNGWIGVWHSKTGRLVHALNHGGKIRALEFSPDGSLLIAGSHEADDNFKIWDVSNGKVKYRDSAAPNSRSALVAMGLSPDGEMLATGDNAGHLVFREAKTGISSEVVRWPTKEIRAIVYGKDGKTIVTSSGYGQNLVMGWDTRDRKTRFRETIHTDNVLALAVNADRTKFVSAGYDGTAYLWDMETGKLLIKLLENGGRLTSVVFAPDSRHVLISSDRGEVYMFRLEAWVPQES